MKKIHLLLIFSACTASIYSSELPNPKSRGQARYNGKKAVAAAIGKRTKYKDKQAPNSPHSDDNKGKDDKAKK